MHTIDSAIKNPYFQQKILVNGRFHYELIAPDGVVNRDIDDMAWQVAKTHNMASRVKFSTMAMITEVYDDQARIMKLEEEVAKVILGWESRSPANMTTTLWLIRDNYKGWSYDRTPGLLMKYDQAIKLLSDEY